MNGHAPVRLLIDTDLGVDCDDVGALAVAHALADTGECELLGVTHCCGDTVCAESVDAINRFFGRPDVPVGVFPFEADPNAPARWRDVYASAVAAAFPHRAFLGGVPHTVRVLRRALAESGGNVTLVTIGALRSAAALLDSPPDDISPLPGNALLRANVIRTVVMGGRFDCDEPEWNLLCDLDAARRGITAWPTPLVLSGWEIGAPIRTGKPLAERADARNPVTVAYRVHGSAQGRSSWDLTAVLYAVRPDAGDWETHVPGRIELDARGVTRWTPDANGQQTYLIKRKPDAEIAAELDALMVAACAR